MADAFLDTVARFVDRHTLLAQGAPVLVGVSGGVDSMVCLDTLRRLGYDVAALHVNYGLREGADADEDLVCQWCEEHSVSLTVREVDVAARAEGESLQALARELRYGALAMSARDQEISAVATGHHRDDQAETVLLNLVRGTGPEGLAGMPPSRPLQLPDADEGRLRLVRPLLVVSRSEIEHRADRLGIPWRTDPTNRDPSYDRAAVRTSILPRLNERFDGASRNIARAASLMREYVEETVTPALDDRMDHCFSTCEEGGWVDRAAVIDQPSVWRRRLLLEALDRTLPEAARTYAMATQLERLVEAQVGARVDVTGGAVWRERGGLRFLPASAVPEPVSPHPVPWGEKVSVAHGTLRVDPREEEPDEPFSDSRYEEYVDLGRLRDPLTVRTWRDGDRFQPLGMAGTKLVSDLLTDAQVPSHRRHAVCVLTTDQRIAWVIGHRLDHRVRVRSSTEQVARLTWDPRNREKAPHDCNST